MTARRYAAYRRFRANLSELTFDALADAERDLLCDAAEGLLLARTPGDEVDELRTKAAVALSLLVGMGRWSDAAADELWRRLVACGPLAGHGAERESRAVQHA